EDVLAAGQLRMEAGADLEQAADATANLGATLRRARDARQDLEQRRLAGAVVSDDPDHLALLPPEGNVAQAPGRLLRLLTVLGAHALDPVHDRVAQGAVCGLELTDAVLLRDAF